MSRDNTGEGLPEARTRGNVLTVVNALPSWLESQGWTPILPGPDRLDSPA
jgi:hypothetical protein